MIRTDMNETNQTKNNVFPNILRNTKKVKEKSTELNNHYIVYVHSAPIEYENGPRIYKTRPHISRNSFERNF